MMLFLVFFFGFCCMLYSSVVCSMIMQLMKPRLEAIREEMQNKVR